MSKIANQSVQKVAKGTGIVFFGGILSLFLAFIAKILIARNFTLKEFGIFSLCITILNLSVNIGALGLQNGTARQIAYYNAKKEYENVNGVISYSLLFGVLAGFFLSVLFFFSSEIISVSFFHLPELSFPLRIFSISIPFLILIHILIAIFRGFGRTKERLLFEDLLRNILFILFLLFVIWIELSFEWGITSYTISIIITAVVFIIYFIKNRPITIGYVPRTENKSIGKELLIFSLPLLLVTILSSIMISMDTLMLGFFKTPETVGLYSAAIPLGRFISNALNSMLFIYVPVVSDLYAKNRFADMRRSYAILTKWLCTLTFPLAMIFVFYADVILDFLYGSEFLLAVASLQILSIGFFFNNLMGPNGATLTAMGRTRFLMWATFIAACINIGLNVLLIPIYSINGAAIATIIALVSINMIRSIKVYSISKIHSLTKNNVKPLILSSILFSIFYFITNMFLVITYWMLPIILVTFLILFVISLILTRSVDSEDIDMILNIKMKIISNLMKIKRVLRKKA